jgi:hypothetical protein
MSKKKGSGKGIIIIILILAGVILFWKFGRRAGAPFNSAEIAASETRMWQAYYGGNPLALNRELVDLLKEQFGFKSKDAQNISASLVLATWNFLHNTGSYEKEVLPNLVSAYTQIRDVVGGIWSPEEAAKAELEWWVNRRTPGKNSPENVGKSIAKLYSILYGKTNPHIEKAGLLRAQAAALRDRLGLSRKNSKEWDEVEKLLEESYASLIVGITY